MNTIGMFRYELYTTRAVAFQYNFHKVRSAGQESFSKKQLFRKPQKTLVKSMHDFEIRGTDLRVNIIDLIHSR